MAKRLRSPNLPPPTNHLLAALSSEVFDRIAPSLDVVPLTLKQFVHKPGERIRDIYFPGGGFISIVTVLNDGSMVEVATVGREGLLGASAILNGAPSLSAAMVQAETDTCYRMPADVFREEIDRRNSFHDLMTRDTHRRSPESSCSQRPATPFIRSNNVSPGGCCWRMIVSARMSSPSRRNSWP